MTESAGALRQTYNATAVGGAFIADLALLGTLWCVASAIVNPLGDFPLIDDWSFGRTVQHLLETGEYHPLGWTSMTLISNVLWGALFCLPGEFSFTALRFSTLLAGWFGLAGSYVLVRDLQQPRWVALLVALTVGLNPLYHALSHTFMTDVPFTALAIWSAVLLARSLKSGSDWQLFIGTLLALAATLSRQLALCVPLAFTATLVLIRGFALRNLLRAVAPSVVSIAALLAFNHWLAMTGRSPALYGTQTDVVLQALQNGGYFIMNLFVFAFVMLFYLGLFLSPVLLFATEDLVRVRNKPMVACVGAGILTILLGAGLVTARYGYATVMPMAVPGNILIKSGIGPLALRDTHLLHLDHMPALPAAFWIPVTLLGFLGALLLVVRLSACAVELLPKLRRRGWIGDTQAACLFLLLCALLYMLPLLALGVSDRYLVPLIPFFAAAVVASGGGFAALSPGGVRSMRLAAFALLSAFGLIAIGITRDFLAWNRVRWEALHDLQRDSQVDATQIDGGAEFNALYLYDPDYKEQPGRSGWWVHADTYLIGFGAVPGYTVVKQYTYQHWLPFHVQSLVVLRKE